MSIRKTARLDDSGPEQNKKVFMSGGAREKFYKGDEAESCQYTQMGGGKSPAWENNVQECNLDTEWSLRIAKWSLVLGLKNKKAHETYYKLNFKKTARHLYDEKNADWLYLALKKLTKT